ncbi:hypothetical protein RJT34_14918 [Clitoria ternatea]|uniref:BHLH domain-containing protein n=1 Tax=Clitoria ternatea TaxID=43366 RepID=A0AAN9JRR0_CLITE
MHHPMEGVFSLPVAARTEFIHSLVQSFGCSYICLWAYDSIISPNRLSFLDGFYNVRNSQPSSSLGTVAQRLFSQLQTLTFDVNDDRVPGLAFRNRRPYLELQQLELLRLASTDIQTQFFREARIKTVVFMGCNKGEIELGFLNMSQVDIQAALRSLFPEDFSKQPQQIDQNPPSSSSSSLRSISTGSPENSSLLFSIPGTSQSHFPPPETLVPPMQPVPNTATTTSHHQQQALAQVSPTQFSIPETEQDAIIRAILHVISPSSQNLPYASVVHPEASAFQRYRPDTVPNNNMGSNFRRQSLMKRSFAFFRSLNFVRMRDRLQATRPSNTQLHHMISERRRREKLNENFQALRALLPPGTKKDKASILIAAKEILSSLMAEVDKLSKRNQELKSIVPGKETTISEETKATLSSNKRLNVRISHVPESSSSEERMVELQVNVRGQVSQIDLLIRLLEFLKRAQQVSLVSMDTNTHNIAEGNALHQLTFRLRIVQGSEWDESGFEEAVRRVVGDLIQYQVDP